MEQEHQDPAAEGIGYHRHVPRARPGSAALCRLATAMRKGLAAPVALLALAACGGYAPSELARPEVALGAPSATLVLRRDPGFVGAGVSQSVLLDGRPLANLSAGDELAVPVPTGPHVVDLECGAPLTLGGNSASRSVTFEPGRTYVIRTYGSFYNNCQMQLRPSG